MDEVKCAMEFDADDMVDPDGLDFGGAFSSKKQQKKDKKSAKKDKN